MKQDIDCGITTKKEMPYVRRELGHRQACERQRRKLSHKEMLKISNVLFQSQWCLSAALLQVIDMSVTDMSVTELKHL